MNRFLRLTMVTGALASNALGMGLFALDNAWLRQPILSLKDPGETDVILAIAALLSAMIGCFRTERIWPILTIGLFTSYLLLVDVMLFQPYNYFYLLIYMLTYFEAKGRMPVIRTVSIAMAGLYVWSGLQKLDYGFAEHVFYNMFYALFDLPHYWSESRWRHLALGAGLLEIAGGAMLLFGVTRISASLFLMAMHLTILAAIGPLGIDWNPTVWPWNMVMVILLLAVLSARSCDSLPAHHLRRHAGLGQAAVLGCFWLLPALSIIGSLPSTFGWSLYSSRRLSAYVCLESTPEDDRLRSAIVQTSADEPPRLYMELYYQNVTGTAILPERAVLQKCFMAISQRHGLLGDTRLRFGESFHKWSCD